MKTLGFALFAVALVASGESEAERGFAAAQTGGQAGASVAPDRQIGRQGRQASEGESEIRMVILVNRHGVRPPRLSNEALAKYAAQPWPAWDVPPGWLTPHGARQMELVGGYFRLLYLQEGLLSGRIEEDIRRVYLRADQDERTVESARSLAVGLLPEGRPEIHARPRGTADPLFAPGRIPLGHPSQARADAAVLGRMGGDPSALVEAHRPAYTALEEILLGTPGAPPLGKRSIFSRPAAIGVGEAGLIAELGGPIHLSSTLTDNLLLEYAEGMPMRDVGWGRVSRPTLTQLLELHSLYFDFTQRTFYPAQVQASNLASHLLQTLEQAVSNRTVPGAIGEVGDRLVVVMGHDTNQANLSGLLGLSWLLPGAQECPLFPGGALVFELWRHRTDGRFEVRIRYVSQTLEQTRALDRLTLDHPPAVAPIFVPACSEPTQGYPVPFERFEGLLRRVIDPEFVTPESS